MEVTLLYIQVEVPTSAGYKINTALHIQEVAVPTSAVYKTSAPSHPISDAHLCRFHGFGALSPSRH